MKKIKIYTSPTCTHCQSLKEWLTNHQQSFEEFNVYLDEDARDFIIKKSQQMSVPVILINDADGSNEVLIAGFDEDKISTALGLE
jgi:glutaredoxin 3